MSTVIILQILAILDVLVQEYTVATGNTYVLASIVNAISSPYLNTAPIPGHVCALFLVMAMLVKQDDDGRIRLHWGLVNV